MKSNRHENLDARLGFTLVELLVVVAVVCLLASLLMPSLLGAAAKAKQMTCVNNQRELGLATRQYCGDNNDWCPEFSLTNAWWKSFGIADVRTVRCTITVFPSLAARDRIAFNALFVNAPIGQNTWGPARTGIPPKNLGCFHLRYDQIARPDNFIQAVEADFAVVGLVPIDDPSYDSVYIPAIPFWLGTTPGIGPGHNGTDTPLFADGHVALISTALLTTNTSYNMARWSSDGLPHPELH